MDSYIEDIPVDGAGGLSYDDTLTYEEQIAAMPAGENSALDTNLKASNGGGLASRISVNKAYVAPELVGRAKRKRNVEDEGTEDIMDVEYVFADGMSTPIRQNALLLKGSPISHLPTGRIFAYARHFDADPVALEWIDDTSCVLVFSSASSARSAQSALLKTVAEEPDEDGYVAAKPIPELLWPPEDRINKTLGMGQGLKGTLHMRWAGVGDVKKRGARKDSEFYRKHGMDAGKDPSVLAAGRVPDGDRKRRRQEGGGVDDEEKRRQLDAELDDFLAEDEDDPDATAPDLKHNSLHRRLTSPSSNSRSQSPPSKMRSDYIDGRGRSLLERTSLMRAHPDDLEFEESGFRDHERTHHVHRGGRRGRGLAAEERSTRPLPRQRGDRGESRKERPRKTQQELDDELEAFLSGRA